MINLPFGGNMKLAICLVSALLLTSLNSMAQKKAKIQFEADNIEYDESLGKKAKRLIGNVVFKHKGVFMYCDSAYQYPMSNSLDAFGRVHIKQGDSLDLYCDSLHYQAQSQIFTCRKNVVLDNKNIHLTTDNLIYDRSNDMGYYLSGGKIINREDQSTLTSEHGYYYTLSDDFYFKKNVEYIHPEFKMVADTLKYNSKQNLTHFLGPTDIYADSNVIHCEKGYFNSVSKISEYNTNAYIISDNRIIHGDSIYYDANIHFGQINGNAEIIDTSEDVSVLGHIALLYEDRDSALVTDSAELRQYFDHDTLFMHADTFIVYKKDSLQNERELQAYHHVRFFKPDLQGQCDSMIYSFADSAIKMYNDPILWTGDNQITGTYIQLNMVNGQMDNMKIEDQAFVNSKVDSIHFNQIRGKDMTAIFVDNMMRKIIVVGNGQTIYYALDDVDKFIGVNRGQSSDLSIKLADNEITHIAYINDANATFFPMHEISTEELRLKGFSWRIELRPLRRKDIFR